MKIYFVGIHNKKGMIPLCSSTKSGKLINRIIAQVSIPVVKTNLCDLDYLPIDENEIIQQKFIWLEKYDPNKEDVIILLGNFVHKNFPDSCICENIIKIKHPASQRSKIQMDEYVEKALVEIDKYCRTRKSITDLMSKEQREHFNNLKS